MSMPEYRAIVDAFAPFEPLPKVRVEFRHGGKFRSAALYSGTTEQALDRALEHLETLARCRALPKGLHEAVAGGESRAVMVD